jgi:hypothetical protein
MTRPSTGAQLQDAADQARRDEREYMRMRLTHDAHFDDARTAVRGSSQVQVSPHLQSIIDRVAAMTDEVHSTCKPASAKPIVQLPQRWNINDAVTRDPVSLLTEVYDYSVLTGQDAVKELTKSLEPSMANAAGAILDAARVSLSPAVRWNKMCSIFLELVGRNIFNHDATTKLLRGDIKHGSQTVLEYGMRMRVAVHQAVSMPGMAICELFIRGLRPELINVCARTEAGLILEDFVMLNHGTADKGTLSIG